MIDETFIRHNFFNMLKIFRRTRLIETDANVHKRIHTNSTTMDDEHNTNWNVFYSGPIRKYTQVDVGVVRPCVPLSMPIVIFQFMEDFCNHFRSKFARNCNVNQCAGLR